MRPAHPAPHRPAAARLLLSALLVAAAPVVTPLAEEGMWQPAQLPQLAATLKDRGLRLDPARLADLHAHPMGAIISLGNCTASFVSPDGLAVTNHHCAYSAIQYNSTEGDNLLDRGFVASSREAELFAGPGSRILVTVSVTDVTGEVLGGLADGLGGRERYQAIEDREKELVAACEKDPGHRCRVAATYDGMRYELVKQLEIRDVRLVYAPPGSIGKYGGDIDNWMWPRHTGDFSFYRAYVGPDGKPADPGKANVPYHPAHHLRLATRSLAAGDFVMVAGYPGRTSRHRLASEVESRFQWSYPILETLFKEWVEIIEAGGAADADAGLRYASRVAGLNNSIKNYQGMMEGFAKSDILARKQAQRRELEQWLEADAARKARYGPALKELDALVLRAQATRERGVYYEFLGRNSSLLGAARTLYRLAREKEKPDMQREPGYQERDLIRIRERLTRLDRTFAPAVDRAVWAHFIKRYAAIPADQHVGPFDAWFGIDGNTLEPARLEKRLDEMYAGTKLGDQEARLAWMDRSRQEIEKSDDPFLRLAVQLHDSDMALEEEEKTEDGLFQAARARYMEALSAFLASQGKPLYPDANSTLRVSFGKVQGSQPRDGLRYEPFTTLAGVLEKDTGEDPFNAPEPLLAAMRQGRHGRHAAPALASVPVNFLADLDSTGGNSGSPVLNAHGELVGLLFDGTYESIISDWDYIRDKTRAISVDIRYALWIMEQVGGAGHLLAELSVPGAGQERAGR